jgi:hypothetical protein
MRKSFFECWITEGHALKRWSHSPCRSSVCPCVRVSVCQCVRALMVPLPLPCVVSVCLPWPTLSPTDPVPRAYRPRVYMPTVRVYAYMYACVYTHTPHLSISLSAYTLTCTYMDTHSGSEPRDTRTHLCVYLCVYLHTYIRAILTFMCAHTIVQCCVCAQGVHTGVR